MLRPLVVLALALAACKTPPPPVQYGAEKQGLQERMLVNSFQSAYDFGGGEQGPLAFPAHKWDDKLNRYVEVKVRPERCYFKVGVLLQTFEATARLSAPGAPTWAGAGRGEMWLSLLVSDREKVEQALQSLFGRSLVTGTSPTASQEVVTSYDGAAIEAIFRKLYARPTEMRGGYLLQTVYDVMYRNALRSVAQELALYDAHPDLLAQAQKEWDEGAMTDPDFSMYTVADHILPTLQERDPARAPIARASFLGTVVRRTHDGTLPVLRQLLAQVLRDYDPTFDPTQPPQG